MPWYNLDIHIFAQLNPRYCRGLLNHLCGGEMYRLKLQYCKTNGNSLKNLYIKKRFINNLLSAATMHLFILLTIAIDTEYNYRKQNNNT